MPGWPDACVWSSANGSSSNEDAMTESQTTLKGIGSNENIVALLGFAVLLVAAHFSGSNVPALRLTLGAALVVFWIPPLYVALVDWHCMYLWFLVLVVFMIGTLKLAERPAAGFRT